MSSWMTSDSRPDLSTIICCVPTKVVITVGKHAKSSTHSTDTTCTCFVDTSDLIVTPHWNATQYVCTHEEGGTYGTLQLLANHSGIKTHL